MPDLHRRLPRRRDHRSGHASRRQPRHLHRLRRLHFRMPAGRDLQRRGRRRKMDQVQRRRIREGLIPFQTRKNQTPVRHIGGGFSLASNIRDFPRFGYDFVFPQHNVPDRQLLLRRDERFHKSKIGRITCYGKLNNNIF